MDFKKEMKNAWEASIPSTIVLATMVAIIYIIANFTEITVISENYIIVDLIHFVLFLYAGFRATYNLKGSMITAGLAGSTCAAIIGLFDLILLTIAMIFVMGSDPEIITEELATQLGGETAASTIVILVAIMIFGIAMMISAIINFAVGVLGGYVGEKLRGKKQ